MKFSRMFLSLTLITLILHCNNLFAASYGSDTAVNIYSTAPIISGPDNIINSFACLKSGFNFTDASTTCSYNSMFPLTGEITLNGGNLWLTSDLFLNNNSFFTDYGTIYGQGHAIHFPQNFQNFPIPGRPIGNKKILTLLSRVIEEKTIGAIDWSYDGNYVAVSLLGNNTSGTLNELKIYSFNGTQLTYITGFDYDGIGYDVKWHPSSYFLVTSTAVADKKINLLKFTPPNTLELKDSQSPDGTFYAVAWNGSGTRIAAGGTAALTTYRFNQITTSLDSQITPTNTALLNGTITTDNLRWAPRGNKDDLIAGTNAGSLHLYNFTGSALNHVKNYKLGSAINGFDWSKTSTYIAICLADNTIRTYQHTASLAKIFLRNTYTASSNPKTISWSSEGTELVAGLAVSGLDREFKYFDFDKTTYALTKKYEIDLERSVLSVKWGMREENEFVLRSDAVDNTLSVYKPTISSLEFRDTKLFFNSDLSLGSDLTFSGNCSIETGNHTIKLTGDGGLHIANDSSLNVQHSTIEFPKPSGIVLQGPTSKVIFDDTRIVLDSDILWGDGSFEITGDTIFEGNHTINYESNYSSSIRPNSSLTLERGTTLWLGKSTPEQQEPLTFADKSSTLNVTNAKIKTKGQGINIIKGTVNIYGDSIFDIDNTYTAKGITLGDGISAANDPSLNIMGGSLGVKNGGINFDAAVTPTFFQFSGQGKFNCDANKFYANRPVLFTNGWVEYASPAHLQPNAYIIFNNTRRTDDANTFDYYATCTIAKPGQVTLDINDKLIFNTGAVPYTTIIKGNGNVLSGNGAVAGQLVFTDSASELTWDLQKPINQGLDMKGGRLIISQDTSFAPSYSIVGTGTIDLGKTTLNIGSEPVEFTADTYWIGNGATIKLNNDVSLSGNWTFSGNCIIDIGSYLIDFLEGGNIILEPGAHVEISNGSLYDLQDGHGIICNGDDSQVKLNFVDLVLSGDYSFDKGSIFLYYDAFLSGYGEFDQQYTFSYTSSQPFIIDGYARLELKPGAKFSIGRLDSTDIDPTTQPLIFNDPLTSFLSLNGGTFHITSSGVILTRGNIELVRESTIEIENAKSDYGLILGDGVAGDDMRLIISGARRIHIPFGNLVYNNYEPDQLTFGSQSGLINVHYNGHLTAQTNLTLKEGSLWSESAATHVLNYKNGATLKQNNLLRVYNRVPFAIERRKLTDKTTYELEDGDYYYVQEGEGSNDLFAVSGKSYFGGNGEFSGSLTLKNHTVTVDSNLISPLKCNVALNGGTIQLSNPARFASDNSFTGSGTIICDGLTLSFGTKENTMTNTLLWQGGTLGGAINLKAKANITGLWAIDNSIVLNGFGNELDLSHGGIIRIRPQSTLTLADCVIKGLDTNKGRIEFMDDTSTLQLSNIYLQLDNNLSTTIGGIVVAGPTTVELDGHNWTLDQKASMTINGVTLWQDSLGAIYGGKIGFGSGSIDKYLTLVSSGTIKTLSDTSGLTTQLRTQSHAISLLTNEMEHIEVTGLVDGTFISAHIDEVDAKTRANSNALLYLNNQNTIAHNTLAGGIRTNSNALVAIIGQNDVLATGIRVNSNALLTCCRTTSNALITLINQNVIAHDTLTTDVRVNSNALLHMNDQNSTAHDTLTTGIRISSNALIECCRVSSNALLSSIKTASNSIVLLSNNQNSGTLLRTTSNAVDKISKNINVINASLLRTTSNALVRIKKLNDTDHSSYSKSIRVNSNALVRMKKLNDTAHTSFSKLIRVNSNALVALKKRNHLKGYLAAFDNSVKTGEQNIDQPSVNNRSTSKNQNGPIIFGNGSIIELDEARQLSQDWECQGSVIINGNGAKLDLGAHNITIGQSGKLTFKDVFIDGLRGNNLRCLNDEDQLLLNNCALRALHPYTIKTGCLRLEDEIIITGTNTITYQSNNPAIAAPHSTILVDIDAQFLCEPTGDNSNPLVMEDETAVQYKAS